MSVDKIIAATGVDPRPYQSRIVQTAVDMFTGQHRNRNGQVDEVKSVMVESPTGSGKTVMALLTDRCIQAIDTDLHLCWVEMRRNLLSQADRENREKMIGVSNISFVSMFDKNPGVILDAKRDGRKILMIVDEAHHDAASSCAHLHNILDPDFVLGLTATPFRTDQMKLCFNKVIKDAGIHRLISDGYLSKFDHYMLERWTPDTVAKKYLAETDKWGKSVFYFKNLDLCYELQRLLASSGVGSEVVTGESDWEKQLEDFSAGRVNCLINCAKLTEGFDEPSIKTVWVRDSGRGCTMQMAGRALRKLAGSPVKIIVQSKGTRHPFIKTAMPVAQYVESDGAWASLTVNPKIDAIGSNAMLAIAQSQTSMPQYIANKTAGNRRRRIRFS